jgi:hypothetical protein
MEQHYDKFETSYGPDVVPVLDYLNFNTRDLQGGVSGASAAGVPTLPPGGGNMGWDTRGLCQPVYLLSSFQSPLYP